MICLDDNGIDYQLETKESRRQARSPLAGYFESEIYIDKKDFAKADRLLKDIIKKFS